MARRIVETLVRQVEDVWEVCSVTERALLFRAARLLRDTALLLCAAAHYRIVDTGATFECRGQNVTVVRQLRAMLRPADAATFFGGGSVGAKAALELGLASEVDDSKLLVSLLALEQAAMNEGVPVPRLV